MAQLQEIAREVSVEIHDHYCVAECRKHNAPGVTEFGEERILAALRRVKEEAREEARVEISGLYSQAMGHASKKPTGCEMRPCWVCVEVAAARAEGERAGREA